MDANDNSAFERQLTNKSINKVQQIVEKKGRTLYHKEVITSRELDDFLLQDNYDDEHLLSPTVLSKQISKKKSMEHVKEVPEREQVTNLTIDSQQYRTIELTNISSKLQTLSPRKKLTLD